MYYPGLRQLYNLNFLGSTLLVAFPGDVAENVSCIVMRSAG